MITLRSYLEGRWTDGAGPTTTLVDPTSEEPIARVGGGAIDFGAALAHARDVGGPALRALTFPQRAELLRAMSRAIHARRDELIELAIRNGGNTRGDAKFDVDGAAGTLAAYAELGAALGEGHALADGDGVQLGRSPRLFGQHAWVAREGVAVQINAFNFPAWGFAEKAAVALLAGMPVLTKPASATALVAARIVEALAEDRLLPEGALGLVAGGAGDLIDRLGGQDVLAFTGSSATAARLRGAARVVAESVRVNVEADSLNAALLGPDVEPGSATWELFVGDVARDVTQKAGQKCTAIRRVLVPEARAAAAREALSERLGAVRVGDPRRDDVGMGPLATRAQLDELRAQVGRLAADAGTRVVRGGPAPVDGLGVAAGRGFFFAPTLLECPRPSEAAALHAVEPFGPVATLAPYDGRAATAAALVRLGGGGLVASVYSNDRAFLREAVLALAPHHGRVAIGSDKIAGQAIPPGTVLPQLVHGGPGRAGGGEELGGRRGLAFYMQRVALQGDKALLEAILAPAG